jgi:hypothetical protein
MYGPTVGRAARIALSRGRCCGEIALPPLQTPAEIERKGHCRCAQYSGEFSEKLATLMPAIFYRNHRHKTGDSRLAWECDRLRQS